MELQTNTPAKTEASAASCLHCGLVVIANASNSLFCCRACEAVYGLLQDRGLNQYYELRASSGNAGKNGEAASGVEDFSYLDDAQFLELYSKNSNDGSNDRIMEFYLEGVHCAACVWLIEKLPEFVKEVSFVRLNLGRSIATARITELGSFSELAQEFSRIGYKAHPIQQDEAVLFQKKENRLLLMRLGVAGACAGNIMILAVSLYGGASGSLGSNFRYISFFLFLPILFFSAVPFYKSAWVAVKARQSSIDIPVVFGLLLGSVVSIFNLFTGTNEIYFDSLSALIFLLLSTRYLLKRMQQSALGSSHLLRFLTPSTVRKWSLINEEFLNARLDEVKAGDTVQVRAGELIPVDGTLSKGKSFINYSLLTGESNPVAVKEGDYAFAGTVNLDAPIELLVKDSGSQSRLGKILQSMEDTLQKKAPIAVFADRISRIFVLIILAISIAVLFGGFYGNWHDSLNRALALTIVTCPCAFALATPLSFSHVLGRLASVGILVKGPEVLERLTQIKSVFLDKTGTLTEGKLEVMSWLSIAGDQAEIQAAVLALESNSAHHIAETLTNYLKDKVHSIPSVNSFHEVLGKGISGKVSGHLYELRRSPSLHASVDVFRDHQLVSSIRLGDKIRADSAKAVHDLQKAGFETRILTGDNSLTANAVAKSLKIDPSLCISSATPEEKGKTLKSQNFSLMVGDGANDAIALAAAHVGIAIRGSAEIGMRAADVYINRPRVEPVVQILVIAQETMKVVKRNFSFTIFYNIVAGIAAVTGKIDPLFAAILMPISAMTVFLSSMAGTRLMNKAFKELNQ